VLKQLRDRLRATRTWAQASLAAAQPASAAVLVDNRDLIDPLELCFQSLHECGMGVIADGPLLDCLRRAVTSACSWCAWTCARMPPAIAMR
jgi:phosphoenolpyruvate carboxylase